MSGRTEFTVGTRASALALWQTRYVAAQLRKAWPERISGITERVISTVGDRKLEQALHTFGGKGAFTEELEAELRNGSIDFAVHSLKDLPTLMPAGLVLGAIPVRAAAADAFVSADGTKLDDLPQGARIGTSSLRRTAQLLARRPDLQVESIRGNVQTRLKKIETGLAGVILARAGLERLGLADVVTEDLAGADWLPAAGQGALAVQCRADDTEMLALLAAIHDETTAREVGAERSFLNALEGGCQVPVGARAEVAAGRLHLRGLIASLDGTEVVRGEVKGAAADWERLGRELAAQILADGGREIWTAVQKGLEV